MKLFHLTGLCIIILLVIHAGMESVAAQEESQPKIPMHLAQKIDPHLLKTLLTAEAGEPISIIVEMKTVTDLTSVYRQNATPSVRRQAMVSALQATAQTTQAGVTGLLAQNQAEETRSLWIINAVATRVGPDTVLALAARDDVALVRQDDTVKLPPAMLDETARAADEIEWGITQINADEVWNSLGVDGNGVVVANIDTGVDYLHPDLRTNYRGYRGGSISPVHFGNWFDAIGEDAVYPVDTNGHGTHTMGTSVGKNGIGVAPGAQWIAVRAFNSSGSAQESWLHTAFQWILAPEGNPALAPDVVNNSWSNSSGSDTKFQADVQLLIDAGITPIFSAGNDGPGSGSVDSPASYSFAVGAASNENIIASFSSRGPSAWGAIKPDVTAPGVAVLSALPGGGYGTKNGTSMAAPHVSGVAALVLQADHSLTYPQLTYILTTTATPLGETSPNNNYGWGLVNAYAATQLAAGAGQITGTVTHQATSAAVVGATITLIPRHNGITNTTTTNANGFYRRGVVAGDYDVTATAFGFAPQTQNGVTIITATGTTQNFALAPLPTGTLNGTVTETGTGAPLAATVIVNQTPITAATNAATGQFSLALPAGSYTLTVTSPKHRIGSAANLSVTVGNTTPQNFSLASAPGILLVDSGPWYQESRISFYRQALQDARYVFDEHRIFNIPADTPISTTLTAYDVVVWSAPSDSPGYVGADNAVIDFLEDGGNLFLSGQDVAFFDGGGNLFGGATYYPYYLMSLFAADNAGTDQVAAINDDIFSGLNLTISGGDGANNQVSPDVIKLRDPDYATQVLAYGGDTNAGQRIGHCLPYRAINLPFGLEAVSRQEDRAALIETSLNWFQAPSVSGGVEALPVSGAGIGAPGTLITHTVRVRNLAESGPADTITFTLQSNWPVDFPYTTIPLEPCQTAWLTFTVSVPSGAVWNSSDTLTLTTHSTLSPTSSAVITRENKAPAPLLLVDDDRWYDFEDEFMQSLTANNIAFDYWSVQGANPQGTPPLNVLQRYPSVVWFTAYDWHSPLTSAEEATLRQYLDGGGRLALTSQEYLYGLPNHKASTFAQTYLGIESHTEYLTTTVTTGVPGNPIGNGLGPVSLTFPPGYKNWTDSITPTAQAQAVMINQTGYTNSVMLQGGITETWHTAFYAFGPELLPQPERDTLLRRTVGWLSWLGASNITADKSIAAGGDTITYQAVLRNDGLATINNAVFTATFPYPLSLIPGSVTGGLAAIDGNAVWNGPLAKGESITFTYQAAVDSGTPYATLSNQTNRIELIDHGLTFERIATIPINVPVWENSLLSVTPVRVPTTGTLTYTLQLENTGTADAPAVTATINIPAHLQYLGSNPSYGIADSTLNPGGNTTINWQTSVTLNQPATLTFSAQVINVPFPFSFTLPVLLDDGYTQNNRRQVEAWVIPYQSRLPIIFK